MSAITNYFYQIYENVDIMFIDCGILCTCHNYKKIIIVDWILCPDKSSWDQRLRNQNKNSIICVIHCMIRLCNVCHNELFLSNLWKCRYHVYWNLSCPLSILKVIFSKSNKEWRLLFWWQLSQCEIVPIILTITKICPF
jgi:hypothetical protein